MADAASIVFIHGMYMNGHSWAPWVDLASARGHACHAPSWPYHDGQPAELRARIDPRLGRLTFGAVSAARRASHPSRSITRHPGAVAPGGARLG